MPTRQKHQAKIAAAVERHVSRVLACDGGANLRISRLQRGRRFDDRHRGFHPRHLEREVDVGVLADAHNHVLRFLRPEALHLGLHNISCGMQTVEDVIASFVGDRVVRNIG